MEEARWRALKRFQTERGGNQKMKRSLTREKGVRAWERHIVFNTNIYICQFAYIYTTVGATEKKRRGIQKMRGRLRHEEKGSTREREILYYIFIHINLYSCTCFCMILWCTCVYVCIGVDKMCCVMFLLIHLCQMTQTMPYFCIHVHVHMNVYLDEYV